MGIQEWVVQPILMDNITCWNIRGLNGPRKQKDVLSFCRKNKVGLLGLVETKVRLCNYDKVAQDFPGWLQCVQYNDQEKGRLWPIWIPEDFTIQILQSTKQAIHCWVTHRFSANTFYLTLVYGDNDEVERKKLQKLLQDLESDITTPWTIMADFNHLLHLDDRIGGLPVTQ